MFESNRIECLQLSRVVSDRFCGGGGGRPARVAGGGGGGLCGALLCESRTSAFEPTRLRLFSGGRATHETCRTFGALLTLFRALVALLQISRVEFTGFVRVNAFSLSDKYEIGLVERREEGEAARTPAASVR